MHALVGVWGRSLQETGAPGARVDQPHPSLSRAPGLAGGGPGPGARVRPHPPPSRDHGGGLDAAARRWGGRREAWLDLSTGINPVPWPGPGAMPAIPPAAWAALPDAGAAARLLAAARRTFAVPEGAALLAIPGASAAIALLPRLARDGAGGRSPAGATGPARGGAARSGRGGAESHPLAPTRDPRPRAAIPGPTYNEHAAAFAAAGWAVDADSDPAPSDALVVVHPNNPDGRLWRAAELPAAPLTVIDESFCDLMPGASMMALAARPGTVVLRSFGKFWGLAGLRLGFAAGEPALIGALAEALGPWPVSGPALEIGAAALDDAPWAEAARARLAADAARLDALVLARGARLAGGTDLFRLYEVADAGAWADHLARARILARTFPWSGRLIRLGLPPPGAWARLGAALAGLP